MSDGIDWAMLAKAGFISKGEPRKRTKGRRDRLKLKTSQDVHEYVKGRERNICRICRLRNGQSMHELKFRSLGGKPSRRNSVWACGDGVQGCHGFAQRNEIGYAFEDEQVGAEGTIVFTPQTTRAAEWLRVKVGESIQSAPMLAMEMAE